MSKIFISYKRVDKKEAFRIKNIIEAATGIQCWIDLDGIESDAVFMDVIINAINEAEIVLFMYSTAHAGINDYENDWTIRELAFAKEKHKRIVFVNLDGTKLTDYFIFNYSSKQQVDAKSQEAIDKLIADIRKWLKLPSVSNKRVNTSVGNNVTPRTQVNTSVGNNPKKQINTNEYYSIVNGQHIGNNPKKQIYTNANKISRQSSGVNIKKKITALCNTVIAFFKTKGETVGWIFLICFVIGIWGYIGVDWYKDSHVAQWAQEGDAEAQYKYALQFYNGDGVEQDYGEALIWFRKAAEQGNAAAQYYIGWMYQNGLGVEQDYAEAMKWYRKSAEQGDEDAQNNIGWIYLNGLGVEQDYAEAMKWYRKSAEQGNAAAQNNIGNMYYYGYGVEQDYAETMKWYRKSAEQGDATAQDWIGWLYEHGQGVEKDLSKAAEWYKKAADNGSQSALENYNRLKTQK